MTAVRFAQPQHTMKALPGAAVSFLHPIEGVVLPVLDLDPVLRPAGLIGPIAMLRDQTFEAKLAGLAKQVRSYLALFEGIDEDPLRPAA